jgi:hypothetical protein
MPNGHITTSKEITRQGFIDLFAKSMHAQIAAHIDRPGVLGVVCFECLQMDSSHCGERTALVYGPACTYTNLEDVLGGHLGEVPIRFKYPTHHHVKPLGENGGTPPVKQALSKAGAKLLDLRSSEAV